MKPQLTTQKDNYIQVNLANKSAIILDKYVIISINIEGVEVAIKT